MKSKNFFNPTKEEIEISNQIIKIIKSGKKRILPNNSENFDEEWAMENADKLLKSDYYKEFIKNTKK